MTTAEDGAVAQPNEMASPIVVAKKQLRSLMKQRLAALPEEAVKAQSNVLFKRLLNFRPYVEAKRVSIFLSMPQGEVQTDAIVRHAIATGKQVFVPFLHKSPLELLPGTPPRVMDMVELHSVADYESLERDRWGIPSVDPKTVDGRHRILGGAEAHQPDHHSILDLMLLPGVAFDLDPKTELIRRCGYGRGFYDLFIHRYEGLMSVLEGKEASPLLLYGLALKEQYLEPPDDPVPVDHLDSRLDGLVLGDGRLILAPAV